MPDTALMQQLAALLIPLLSYVGVFAAKLVIPHIPKVLLPLLAGALGPAFDLLLNYVAGIETHGAMSLVLGLGAVGIHEIQSKLVAGIKAASEGSRL